MSVMITNCENCKYKKNRKANGEEIRCHNGEKIVFLNSDSISCPLWEAKTPENNIETTTTDNDLFAMIKDLQKANLKLTRRVSKFEDKVGKLEESVEVLDGRIQKLEDYGKSVYEAIRMLSDDYTERVCKGLCALENGILSQLSKHDFIAKHIEERWAKQNKTIFDDKCKECPEFDDLTGWCNINGNCNLAKQKQALLSEEEMEKSIINGMNYDCDDCENYGISKDECKLKNGCSGYVRYNWKNRNKEPKQEKWIVHRTLRKSNKETYLVDYFCKNDKAIRVNGITQYFSCDKNKAYKFDDENVAIQSRDRLNTLRVGKRYLWVISKE